MWVGGVDHVDMGLEGGGVIKGIIRAWMCNNMMGNFA